LKLQALRDDPEVEIVRVKSSMTKSGLNTFVNTGFRFISVNLRIRSLETKLLVLMHRLGFRVKGNLRFKNRQTKISALVHCFHHVVID
jgi:hypothetical protein